MKFASKRCSALADTQRVDFIRLLYEVKRTGCAHFHWTVIYCFTFFLPSLTGSCLDQESKRHVEENIDREERLAETSFIFLFLFFFSEGKSLNWGLFCKLFGAQTQRKVFYIKQQILAVIDCRMTKPSSLRTGRAWKGGNGFKGNRNFAIKIILSSVAVQIYP